mmetsp:Transcript_12446/g.20654  ORF Transcript_12446/g.20654 Transcript_12446/m.20654 type:complete len:186 (+) Transcript_12446:64-621(+)
MKCFSISLFFLLFSTTNAQFGVGGRNKQAAATEGVPPVDLDDPALIEAMQMFANMSPEEMEETMQELQEILGDDPETLAAIQLVAEQIPNMQASDIQSSLTELITEDEVMVATNEALKMLRDDENAWETIWDQRDEILEAVVASGQMSALDAARFKADPNEWEAELKHIWKELQKEAAARKESRQ